MSLSRKRKQKYAVEADTKEPKRKKQKTLHLYEPSFSQPCTQKIAAHGKKNVNQETREVNLENYHEAKKPLNKGSFTSALENLATVNFTNEDEAYQYSSPKKKKRKKSKSEENNEYVATEEAAITTENSPSAGNDNQEIVTAIQESEMGTQRKTDFTKSVNCYPCTTKSNVSKKIRRLAEFKNSNSTSFKFWQEVCNDLEKQGKRFCTGRFTEEENIQLTKNWEKLTRSCPFPQPHALLMKNHFPELKGEIEEFIRGKNFYVKLGKHINRSPYSVYIRARKIFHPGNNRGRYSQEEINTMTRLREQYGAHWQKIGMMMERSGQSLNDRFKKMTEKRATGQWSAEEDERLTRAIKSLVLDSEDSSEAFYNFPWTEIARHVLTRGPSQCRMRWIERLAFGEEGKRKFRVEDKLQLLYEIMAMDVNHECEINWIELMKKFNVPTPQFLQCRWHHLKSRMPNYRRHTFSEVLEFLEIELIPELKDWTAKQKEDCLSDGVDQTSSETNNTKERRSTEETSTKKRKRRNEETAHLNEETVHINEETVHINEESISEETTQRNGRENEERATRKKKHRDKGEKNHRNEKHEERPMFNDEPKSGASPTGQGLAWRLYFPHVAKATEWLRENRHLFRDAILEPQVTNMTDHEIVKLKAMDKESKHPTHTLAEATSFLFRNFDDIDLFIQKVRFGMNLRVNCAMLEPEEIN